MKTKENYKIIHINILWLALFVLERYQNLIMLLFTHRVSIMIVKILHCRTWTGNIVERERSLSHTAIFVNGDR